MSTPTSAPPPPPVARYLAHALPTGRPAPATVVIEQEGELRSDGRSRRWMAFHARHVASPRDTGFVWDARARIGPGLHVRIVDSLADGTGAGKVLLWSAFQVAHDAGTPEMNSGALHRYLAEAVWYPWALAPGASLAWQAIDDRRALATLRAGATEVSLEFRFAASGDVEGVHSPGRWGRFHGRYAKVPWEGRFAGHARHDGVMVPSYGEVGWYRGDVLELVWKGRIRSIAFR